MNIHELDSYNLGDAVKFNDRLNPKIWGADEQLLPAVREQLLKIADDFRESLGIDVEVEDITISGSNAAYSYTAQSDIDLHLVVDLPRADASDVYRELFDAKKYAYNDQHDIRIGGADVELYVQDARKPHRSQGIYSVLKNDWVSVPTRRRPDVDDISVRSKFEDLGHRIESAINTGNYDTMTQLATKIREYRQSGLDQTGEFGAENLAFKILRNQGVIQRLYDARNAAKDQLLSLDERRKKRKKKSVRYGYGAYWYPGTAYAGQDQPAGTEGGGGDGGGGESLRESVATSDEDILRDFVKFCGTQLELARTPTVKLRRDPQWPVINHTFGRYINDINTLEVAFGQRHIMDVLRTVAHELTHQLQHEREEVPGNAGETGSPYENEANARAGVLMRDYGQLHPEYFAVGQAHDIKEANPVQQLSLYRPHGTTYRGEKMPVPEPDDFHSGTNPRKRVNRPTQQDLASRTATDIDPIAQAEQNIDRQRLKDAIRASMSSLTSNETAVLNMRFWKDLTLAQTARAFNSSAERIRQIEAKALRKLRDKSRSDRLEPFVKEGASGYIPTKRQARDPRYSTALTVDIRPGEIGRQANKLKLKTNSQGQPQIARANGLFEKLALELSQFKRQGTLGALAENQQPLDEVAMSPGALAKWAKSDAAQGIRAGFEAELIFRDTTNDEDDDDEMEPDYDYDERVRSVDHVIDFFRGGDYSDMSSREADQLNDGLNEKYYEWYDERMMDAFRDEAEDLVRTVIKEDDWDLDNEIQKQLELAEVPEDEFNAVIQAGERAPKFDSSKQQQAYIEANPLYKQYLDAQTEAEDLLDTLVEDSVRAQDKYYDAALDYYREHFQIDDDSDFFESVGLTYMSDVAAEYSLSWPYLTGSGGGGNNGGNREWGEIGDSLERTVGMPVNVSGNYHSTTRKEGQWIVEPDSSLSADDRQDMGLEIVSPPMPLLTALEQLQAVTDWANSPQGGNAYTNQSTGLHMGVSVPYRGGDVDYVKLILFLGDEYVLQAFGRESNTYTKSAMSKFRENIRSGRSDPMGVVKLMQHGLLELAYKELQKGVGTGKYTSAHIQDGYIEFRSAGGDWLAEESADPQKLSSTMLRYARAMQIAADPGAEREEFAKKLYKFVAPEGDGQLALFSQYAAGTIDKDQLKKQWAAKTLGTAAPVAGQEQSWEVYNVNTGDTLEIVKGSNRGEAADAVFDKYANQGIGFNLRAYQDPATMTPRAKLAKRIAGKPTSSVKDTNIDVAQNFDSARDSANLQNTLQDQPTSAAQTVNRSWANLDQYNWNITNRDTGETLYRINSATRQSASEYALNYLRQQGLTSSDYQIVIADAVPQTESVNPVSGAGARSRDNVIKPLKLPRVPPVEPVTQDAIRTRYGDVPRQDDPAPVYKSVQGQTISNKDLEAMTRQIQTARQLGDDIEEGTVITMPSNTGQARAVAKQWMQTYSDGDGQDRKQQLAALQQQLAQLGWSIVNKPKYGVVLKHLTSGSMLPLSQIKESMETVAL